MTNSSGKPESGFWTTTKLVQVHSARQLKNKKVFPERSLIKSVLPVWEASGSLSSFWASWILSATENKRFNEQLKFLAPYQSWSLIFCQSLVFSMGSETDSVTQRFDLKFKSEFRNCSDESSRFCFVTNSVHVRWSMFGKHEEHSETVREPQTGQTKHSDRIIIIPNIIIFKHYLEINTRHLSVDEQRSEQRLQKSVC